MGCISCKSSLVVAPNKHVETQPPIESTKFVISAKQFIFHKTSSVHRDYEFGPLLGSGAFGSVRIAVHHLTNQERAIKTVNKAKVTKNMKEKCKYFAEIDILRQLDHPNIVRLYEFYEDAKAYHLVTEVLHGGELFKYIVSSGVLTENIAAFFLRQIMCAVNYCHKRGIVHRDLKPENLLLEKKSPDSNLKIIDFGASGFYRDNMKCRFGTSYYVAPEVLKKNYNEKCDIWSCGVILYVLLSGTLPFPGKTDSEILKNVRKGKYSLLGNEWDGVSSSAKNLIKRMLEYDPTKRYSAEEVLNDDWLTKSLESITISSMPSVIQKLKTFRANEKLQNAVLAFLVSRLSSKEETKQLSDTFKAIDTNSDGIISSEELMAEFMKTMTAEEAEIEVDKIFSQVDTDKNGYIEYSEFLAATIQTVIMISKQKLEVAYKKFRTEGTGVVSADDIRRLLEENNSMLDESRV